MKNVYLVFSLLTVLSTAAQPTFYHKQIDLRDSANATLVNSYTDHLGTILIDAYLKGAINGYKVDVGEEVLKRAPVQLDLFMVWEPNEFYYQGDIVRYKERLYVLQTGEIADANPPSQNSRWKEAMVEGDPVSTRYYFPTLQDTLSKTQFLEKMIRYFPVQYDAWNQQNTYYPGDVVMFKGRSYEAIRDANGVSPENNEYWEASYQGMLQLYQPMEIRGVSILYDGSVEPHQPQMISLLKYNQDMGILEPLGLHFYFADVIQYLNTIDQPMLYNNQSGNLGYPQLVIDDVNQPSMISQLREAIKTKKVKIDKKKIINATEFSQFLGATNDELSSAWRIRQDLTTSDIVLGRYYTGETDYTIEPVASFSWKSVESVFNKEEFNTYRSFLEGDRFNSWIDTLAIDTLQALKYSLSPAQPIKDYYFLDTHQVKITVADSKLQTQVKALWSRVEQDFYKKKLKVINPIVTLFPCEYDWSETTITINDSPWTFSDFSLTPSSVANLDSLVAPGHFTGLSVTYKRVLSKQRVAPEPVEISVYVVAAQKEQDVYNPYPFTYTLRWADMEKYITDSEIGLLLNDIKSAKLNFYDSHISYGVVGVK